jgi:hypothetical protein
VKQQLIAIGIMATLVLGAAPSALGGVPAGGVMTLDPSSGVPGTVFTVTGVTPCFGDVVTGSVAGLPVSGWEATPAVDGSWSKELNIPESIGADAMGNPIPTPPGAYTVFAECRLDGPAPGAVRTAQSPEFQYAGVDFTVVAAPEVPETPETPAEPPAALPVAETPAFTG